MNEFNYFEWRAARAKETGDDVTSVDAYCAMVARDAMRDGVSVDHLDQYLARMGVAVDKDSLKYKHAEALVKHLSNKAHKEELGVSADPKPSASKKKSK